MLSRNIQKIGHFLTVAKAPSLSAAARELGISQPALTLSIRKLESALGFELFDREHGFQLTSLGRELLERAEPMLTQVEDLERQVELLRSGKIGEVRVGCGPTIADGLMGMAAARLLAVEPTMHLMIHVEPFSELPGMLRDRKVDFFVGEYMQIEDAGDFEIEPLPLERIVFYCRAGHPLAGRMVDAEEFCAYPHVGPALPPYASKWMRDNLCENKQGRHLQLECSHHALLKAVVASGDALSGAPYSVVHDEFKSGKLAEVKLGNAPAIEDQSGIVWLRGRVLSPAAKQLVEFLRVIGGEAAGPATEPPGMLTA